MINPYRQSRRFSFLEASRRYQLRWIFRLVVAFLGIAVLLTIIGGFYLSIKTAVTIPEGLIALGSAAVGALAGLLAPSPMVR
jgi:hypothetical protein